MKKTILLVLLVLMVSVALVAAAPGFEKLARLTIWNRTGSTIYIKLTTPKDNGNLHYYLTIKTGLHVYTVQRELYDITYWSCGETTTGIVDIFTQLNLTFTNCAFLHDTGTGRYAYQNSNAAQVVDSGRAFHNMGEPSMEKVHSSLSFWKWDWDTVKGCVIPGTQVSVNRGSETVNGITQFTYSNEYTSLQQVPCGTVGAIWRNNLRIVDNTKKTFTTSAGTVVTYYDPLLRWKKASYGAPVSGVGYWYPWYLSYGRLTARSIHWFVRDARALQSVGAKP
jgi:hypothetical protein